MKTCKKWLVIVLIGIMLCTFTSCTLHLGDTNIELPWWAVTVVSVIPALLIVGVVAWGTVSDNAKSFYVCPHCHHRFKPGLRVLYSPHVNDEYCLTCPHCGKRDFCSMSYDQSEQ